MKSDRKVKLKMSVAVLDGLGIEYKSNNNNVHVMITHKDRRIDFWPSTGKWRAEGRQGVGMHKLLHYMNEKTKEEQLLYEMAEHFASL